MNRLIPTIWWSTIKCCNILWLVDPYHTVIYHKVLYYHVTGWFLPYSYSLSGAVLSCDRLFPTRENFTIKCCTIKCLSDPYHMIIHHQVLCYRVTGWSPLYGDSPSSSLRSCDWMTPTIWWFTIKCCTTKWVPDSLSSTVLAWPNAFFCENVCRTLGTNFHLCLIIINHLMSYLLVNV